MNKLDYARAIVGSHLDQIRELFTAGSKITVIVRPPGGDERDFVMTDDDLDEVGAVVERTKARERR